MTTIHGTTPTSNSATSSGSLPLFVFNTGVVLCTSKFLADKNPELAKKFIYSPIGTTGISYGSMYALDFGLKGLNLLSAGRLNYSFNFNIVNGLKAMPLAYGINATLPFIIDATLGNIPHLETFQAGQAGNQIFSLAASLYTFYKIQTGAAFATRLAAISETAPIASKAGWVGVGILLGVGLTAMTDLAFDLTESTIVHFKTKNSDEVEQMRERTEAEMENLVWRQWYAEGNQSFYGRSIGGFVASTTSSIVKQIMHVDQKYIASEERKTNFALQKLATKTNLLVDFNQSIRSKITEAIIDAIDETETNGKKEFFIRWDPEKDKSDVRSKIRNAYNSYPNIKLFYRYDYRRNLTDTRYFPLNKNPIREIDQLKELINEEGYLDLNIASHQSSDQVKQKQEALMDIAIVESEQEYRYLKDKYYSRLSNPDPTKRMPAEEQKNNPEVKRYKLLHTLRKIKENSSK